MQVGIEIAETHLALLCGVGGNNDALALGKQRLDDVELRVCLRGHRFPVLAATSGDAEREIFGEMRKALVAEPVGNESTGSGNLNHFGSHPSDEILAAVEVTVAFVVVGCGTCDGECGNLILGDDSNHN